MNAGPTTIRLSMLVFDEEEILWRSMSELLAAGIPVAQLCLIGLPAALVALVLPPDLPDAIRNDLARVVGADQVAISTGDPTPLVGRCTGDLPGQSGPPGHASADFDWMDQTLAKKLVAHGERGAVILLVRAATAEQQIHVGRILLRHGRHSLQTHEFTLRAGRSIRQDC